MRAAQKPSPLQRRFTEVAEDFVRQLKEDWGDNLVSVVLYGSVARGDLKPQSDIDLLIVGEALPKFYSDRLRLVYRTRMKVRSELRRHLSYIIKTREEARRTSPLYLDMVEDAVILYDKRSFFQKVLRRLQRKLRELGSQRKWIGDRWYWDLKPDYQFGEVVEL